MTISELVDKAYTNAKEKGWHEKERSPLEYHALIHSEVSEATEEARNGKNPIYQTQEFSHPVIGRPDIKVTITPSEEDKSLPVWDPKIKPEGELIELADVVIRIADYCGSRGWDLEKAIEIKMEYNKTRSWRHDGKFY